MHHNHSSLSLDLFLGVAFELIHMLSPGCFHNICFNILLFGHMLCILALSSVLLL